MEITELIIEFKHPEQEEDEFFYTNRANLDGVFWLTGRLGKVAYNALGEKVDGIFPVFVKKSEAKDIVNLFWPIQFAK